MMLLRLHHFLRQTSSSSCTLLQVMLKAYPNLKEQEARQHLGSFGVSGPLALQSMYTLSGGQKSRVAFAKVRPARGMCGLHMCMNPVLASR